MQTTSIVIPCYDEAARLDPTALAPAVEQQAGLHLLFVDDGSQDGTGHLLETLCRQHPDRMRLLTLPRNVGKAEAVRRGLLAAMARGHALVGYFDADLATPLSAIPGMREAFHSREVQFVIGARVGLLGRQVQRSARRHYLGRVFATAASQVLGLTVYDTQCGAKLFRNTEVSRRIFAEPFTARWSFDVEILARFRQAAARGELPPLEECGVEFPLFEWRDVAGSKLSLPGSVRAVAELFGIWARYR